MRKIIIILIGFVFLFLSCQKEKTDTDVVYRISQAIADTEISYRNENGEVVVKELNLESLEDKWQHSMQLKQGEIVYLTALYHDSASSVSVEILIDGKIYKQKSSVQEPEKYVIASGVVPFE